jgi:hypothetical protein
MAIWHLKVQQVMAVDPIIVIWKNDRQLIKAV